MVPKMSTRLFPSQRGARGWKTVSDKAVPSCLSICGAAPQGKAKAGDGCPPPARIFYYSSEASCSGAAPASQPAQPSSSS